MFNQSPEELFVAHGGWLGWQAADPAADGSAPTELAALMITGQP